MIKVGCCGFPVSLKKYAVEFPVVEVQQTFYQPPRPATAERWRSEVPDEFEFTLKAWQLITHEASSPTYRRLRIELSEKQKSSCGSFKLNDLTRKSWEETKKIAEILRAKIIVFQCPASFKDEAANRKRMEKFFSEIDRGKLIFAWEPRGKWDEKNIKALCKDLNLLHCVDPFKSDCLHGRIKYFRLHGIKGYRYKYTPSDLEALLEKVSGARTAYCMFNNVSMLEDARRFMRLV